jgi:hypothetical protein
MAFAGMNIGTFLFRCHRRCRRSSAARRFRRI